MRAAVYLRQSLDRTGEGLAVSRQREDCLRLCQGRGWDPIEYVDNDTSASKGVRKNYRRMLADIRAGRLDAVVAWDLDRLHRQPMELEEFITLADEKRLALATIGGDADLSTDNGRLFARIKGAVARAEVERKSARQKRSMVQLAESGRGWGVRQFGYTADHDKPEVVKREAKAIKQAYSDVLNNESLYSIAMRWNNAELLTTKGNRWTGTTVGRLLQNPRNAGLRAYKGDIVGEGNWPAIVDRDTWDAVYYVLTDPARRTSRGSRVRTHKYGGILKCGACKKGLSTSKNERGQVVYRCKQIGCGKVVRQQEIIDDWVRDQMVDRLEDHSNWARDTSADREAAKELKEEAKVIQLQMDALAAEFEDDGDLDPLTAARTLRIATKGLQDKLERVKEKRRHLNQSHDLDGLEEADDVGEWYDDLTLERKRGVVLFLCSGIVVNPQGRGGWAHGPLGTGIDVNWHEPQDA